MFFLSRGFGVRIKDDPPDSIEQVGVLSFLSLLSYNQVFKDSLGL